MGVVKRKKQIKRQNSTGGRPIKDLLIMGDEFVPVFLPGESLKQSTQEAPARQQSMGMRSIISSGQVSIQY